MRMIVFPVRLPRYCSIQHIHRLHTGLVKQAKKTLSKKYSGTLCLPHTDFPVKLEGKKRIGRDEEIMKKCKFSEQYDWQRDNRTGSEFTLHDGPPYANGHPHIGHAVNKILKDITVRFECSQGRKVHFVTGWDCHGLPIELKAVKGDKNLPPTKIRQIAEAFALESLNTQRKEFSKWGLLTNWSHHYRTMNPEYVKTQMRKFYEIYEKGLIFRNYMPVYWSPSSKTALAEAELEYVADHRSTSVYLRVKISQSSPSLDIFRGKNLYALIWTTTPWSLVANQAICYNSREEYSVLQCDDDLYIVASRLVNSPQVQQALPQAQHMHNIHGSQLAGTEYIHPVYPGESARPFLPGDHVTVSSGTGLVHTAPAHGQDDFKIGLKHSLPLDCPVDENGRYLDSVGPTLAGLFIMGEGTAKVLDLLKTDILLTEEFTHSYPYDWRTKKPVFLRASKQWFVDTGKLKDRALQAIKTVKIHPQSAINSLQGVLERRPYWCISRQRVWGTPVPVLFNKRTGAPVISRDLIERFCDLVDSHGTSFWWNTDIQEILRGTGLDPSDHILGGDILDIWFDSGISWAAVLGRQADLYLEGLDQFSGWFYTSLLTSVALTGEAPYKEIFVHGFTLDENGNKMSKSVGNVLDPRDVLEGTKNQPARGVDVLRWWVGLHASSGASVLVGENILNASQGEVNKFRNSFKFCVGLLKNMKSTDVQNYKDLRLLDKIGLHKLRIFQVKVLSHYKEKEYNKVCLSLLSFITDVSGTHLHLIKDRLYCAQANSMARLSGLTGIYLLCQGLLSVLCPVVPHLAEEVASSVPILDSPTKEGWFTDETWFDSHIQNSLTLLEETRTRINKEFGKPAETNILLQLGAKDLVVLRHYSEEELSEVLGVLSVQLSASSSQELCIEESSIKPGDYCERCRRPAAKPGQTLCTRCSSVLDSLGYK